MKQFKTIICLFTLVFAFAFIAQAQSDVFYQMKAESQTFDIEAQALKSALNAYERITGIKLQYPNEIVEAKETGGVRGINTPAWALKKILSGTGLSYTITAQGVVVVQKVEEEKVTERPAIELQKTVVTATKTAHALGDVPVEAIVLTKEEIERANVKNAAEALSLVPGIHVRGKSITMQGAPSGYTLVLIDGQRVYFGPGRHPVLELYPADMIEKIEIVKGASSTIYGTDSIGGVVNIITKTASAKPTFSVSTGWGNYGTQKHTLTHGNTIGKIGYSLTCARHLSDGVDPAYDQYENNDFIADLRYKVNEHHQFYVKPSYYHQKKIWSKPNDLMTIRRYMVNSGYKLKMGENLLDVMGAYRKFYREHPDKIAPEVETYEADVKYSRQIAGQYVALAGYHFHEDRINWMGGSQKDKHGSHGPYGQFEANMKPVTIVVGGRLEDHTWWGNKFCPEAKLLYNATDDIKLRASAAKGFRSPMPVVFYEGIRWRGGRYMRQDPNLGPTESWNYQVGAEIDFPGKAGVVRAYLFRNDIEGMHGKYEKTSETKGKKMKDGTVKMLPVYISTNYKEVRTQGLEVSFSKQFPYHLYGTVGYSFWNTENRDTGNELAYRPNHIVKGTLHWSGGYGISINVRAQHVSSQYTDDENTKELDPYALMGVDIAKDILKYAQVFLTVNNIFDKKYEEYDDIQGTEVFCGVNLRF